LHVERRPTKLGSLWRVKGAYDAAVHQCQWSGAGGAFAIAFDFLALPPTD